MGDDIEVKTKTKKELLAEMKLAMDSGDFKAVSKVSTQIAKVVAGEEKAEKDKALSVLVGYTEEIKQAIDKVVQKFIDTTDSKILAAMDGVWFSYDFAEALTTCRLIKSAARKSGGGGGGKKFNVTTSDLLSRHGGEQMGDSGKTFQQAYDEDTGGNARYKVRMKLLKADGLN